MTLIELPYLQRFAKGGKVYHYYRRSGRRIRLHGEPGSPQFLAAYTAAEDVCKLAGKPADRQTGAIPRSLGALIESYKKSTRYEGLAKATRSSYSRMLDNITPYYLDLPVADIPSEWIMNFREEMRETPRKANLMVAVLRLLLSWAVKLKWRTDNPAIGIEPLKTGEGHRIWTPEEVAAMVAVPSVGLPVLIAYWTAQRQGDILRMTRAAYDGTALTVRQGKTGVTVTIPVHEDLRPALDAISKTQLMLCHSPNGNPWKQDHFKHAFADARDKLGLPNDLHFHGLRHTAAARLAEAGASDAEIQSITGHKTRAMIGKYTRQAQQKVLARAAISRLSRNGRAT